MATSRPSLRRGLQGAWDLAFSWIAKEPGTHHVDMPATILLAMLTVSIFWGWYREAGIFSLAWGGLLRIGEATALLRSDLVLPVDMLHAQCHILVRIEEPKTRLRAARHQAAKNLVQLISLVFEDLPRSSRLWPQSTQTLRRRFDLILERLGISTSRLGRRPLDLGSFRPGGATFLLQQTEDSELVRRRGRWASPKVMEIYIQEVMACLFFPELPFDTRQKVMQLAQSFAPLLEKVSLWKLQGIPRSSWPAMLAATG